MELKIFTLIAILFSLNGYAQMKGISALGLGVVIDNGRSEGVSVSTNEYKSRSYSLGYGVFVSDHDKIGMELRYGTSKNEFKSLSDSGGSEEDGESYGGSLTYQHFYPLLKTLYAYAGVNAGYTQRTSTATYFYDAPYTESEIAKLHSAGAIGGVTWFMSKSFALEINIISLNATYTTSVRETDDGDFIRNSKSSGFNLTTQGSINNLGFKIFLLF